MDVRCEKCGTEYEFDEGKLKPAGVTVKCAECGHMFRVRKRAPTNQSLPPPGRSVSTAPPPVPQAVRATPSPSSLKPATGSSQRVWIIRDEEGKVQTCRELATLQQWVVAGRVTRHCEISRTGKSWKKLGGIAELGSFFRIAEEARQRATEGGGRAVGSATVVQGGNGEAAAVPTAGLVETTEPLPGAVTPPAASASRARASRPPAGAAGTPQPNAPSAPAPAAHTEPSPAPAMLD
jgi:predicted Zn finger-like uncharacterized protein